MLKHWCKDKYICNICNGGNIMGKRLVEVLAESYDIRDKFLCVEGEHKGRILFWDKENLNRLTFTDGTKTSVSFSHGGANTNKWILIKA